eukprot:1468277-Prymnesium_polylepis.1
MSTTSEPEESVAARSMRGVAVRWVVRRGASLRWHGPRRVTCGRRVGVRAARQPVRLTSGYTPAAVKGC